MERKFLEEQGLNDSQIQAVMSQYGKDTNNLKSTLDAKSKELDSTKAQFDGLNNQIADRDSKIEELSKSAANNAELQKQLQTAQEEIKANDSKWANKFAAERKSNAINAALTNAGALNVKTVLPLIDTEKISLEDNGNLIGLQEQLDQVKQDNQFLFKQQAGSKPKPKVFTGGNGGSNVPEDKKPSEMTLEEQTKLYKEDPKRWTQLFGK